MRPAQLRRRSDPSGFDARQVESTVQIFTKIAKEIRIPERNRLAVMLRECHSKFSGVQKVEAESLRRCTAQRDSAFT
jgi:hypothetical protein